LPLKLVLLDQLELTAGPEGVRGLSGNSHGGDEESELEGHYESEMAVKNIGDRFKSW
jgi:hypothetical protein